MLLVGDPVPSFFARGITNPRFSFDSAAGRYIVVTFLGSGASPGAQAFLAAMHAETKCLDDRFACAFIVTNDPRDEQSGLLTERQPGIRLFLDFDLEMATLFGAVGRQKDNGSAVALMTWILDPGMRVLRILPINDLATHYDDICAALDGQPAPKADMDAWAPILVVPNVLEPDFCHKLITYGETVGLNDSGYMKTDPKTGETVQVLDQDERSLFARGSAEVTSKTRELLLAIGDVIAEQNQPVEIVGHTDAAAFGANNGYTNWELSADRANAMPLFRQLVTIGACAQSGEAWNSVNRFYMTPITHYRWIKTPMFHMEYHDKATCLDTTRISDWSKPANNAVKFRASYVSANSGEAAVLWFELQKATNGSWMIRKISAMP